MRDDATGLIVAYNAAETVGRALASMAPQVAKIILVDDGSRDATADHARALLPANRLKIIKHPVNRGVGAARATALKAADTPYAVWLDADDEWLPGRVDRLVAELQRGAAYVFDGVTLVSQGKERRMPLPRHLTDSAAFYVQLMRNHIHSIGFHACDLAVAKRIGYDSSLRQAEDYQHHLRALLSGARMVCLPDVYYRQYDMPFSLTRDTDRQQAATKRVLKRLDGTAVDALLARFDLPAALGQWVRAAVAARCCEWQRVTALLAGLRLPEDCVSAWPAAAPADVHPSAFNRRFLQAVAHIHTKKLSTAAQLLKALKEQERPEVKNALGVVHRLQGHEAEAIQYFKAALDIWPIYADARRNLGSSDCRLTPFPLRQSAARDRYDQIDHFLTQRQARHADPLDADAPQLGP